MINIIPMPWQDRMEDQWAANEAVRTLYGAAGLQKPRIAWCSSPATMHRASRMLRQVQAGTAYNMVQALVPHDPDGLAREARVSLLTALIDPDVSTQSGALVINMIERVFGTRELLSVPVADMRELLPAYFNEKGVPGSYASATFAEQVMYPALYRSFLSKQLNPLQTQVFCFMPFVKVCWMCVPPKTVRTNEHGQLHCVGAAAAEWRDGFCMFADRTPKEEKALYEPKTLQLEAGNDEDNA